ncbi:MAG: phage major capsid protein [Propionibacteriaceae bacterium]|nr:phage major capsid protein [Propionibacteriaceae bacterium]
MTITTTTSAEAWSPSVNHLTPGDAVPEALILTLGTQVGGVEGDEPVVRCAFVDDAPCGFIPEGQPIPEENPELSEVLVATGKVASLSRISREQWEQENAAMNLSQSVTRAITVAANTAFLSQEAPTERLTPPTGIVNIKGLITGQVGTSLDGLIDLIAKLQTNLSNPTHVVVSPHGWATLSKIKTKVDSNESLLGAGTTAVERMILGLPVIVTPALGNTVGLVVDKSQVLTAFGGIEIATSQHYFFGSDSLALRATWRFGQTVLHPERLGLFNIQADK